MAAGEIAGYVSDYHHIQSHLQAVSCIIQEVYKREQARARALFPPLHVRRFLCLAQRQCFPSTSMYPKTRRARWKDDERQGKCIASSTEAHSDYPGPRGTHLASRLAEMT